MVYINMLSPETSHRSYGIHIFQAFYYIPKKIQSCNNTKESLQIIIILDCTLRVCHTNELPLLGHTREAAMHNHIACYIILASCYCCVVALVRLCYQEKELRWQLTSPTVREFHVVVRSD